MAVKSKRKMHENGQAAIEMALSLPFVVFLLYYTINAFYTIHTAHVGQKNAAMNLYQRLNHRAQFAVDDFGRNGLGGGGGGHLAGKCAGPLANHPFIPTRFCL
jgi:hypothetical protein